MKRRMIVMLSVLTLLMGACGNSVEDASGTVKVDGGELVLGEYKGLEADRVIYQVSDSDVDNEIDNMLEDFVEYQTVERKAKYGDYVGFDLKSTADGQEIEDYTGDGYGVHIGRGDFDDEFEQHLVGTKAGETEEFTITYEEQYPEEVLAGHTVNYEVKVNGVEELIYPELTDTFVQEQLGYENEEELRKNIRQLLEIENEENAEYSLQSSLLQQVIDDSTFTRYSDKMYKQCKESLEAEYLGYADMFGCSTVQEVYDSFGMTQEDVEKEILSQVYTRMVVEAIAEKESIKMSNKEYQTAMEEYALSAGFENADGFIKEFGEDEARFMVLKERVQEFLIDHATITEKETEQLEEFE